MDLCGNVFDPDVAVRIAKIRTVKIQTIPKLNADTFKGFIPVARGFGVNERSVQL